MKPNNCQNCQSEEFLYGHHVIPKSLGGKLIVYLCGECHSIVHDRKVLKDISALTKAGLAKAKARGVILGRRPTSKKKINQAKILKDKGLSYAQIGKIMGLTRSRCHQLVTRKSEL